MDVLSKRHRHGRFSLRRKLQLESLETRQVLSTSALTPTIAGTVFQDANSDSQPSPGEGLAGVTVRLYLDNGDGVFDPGGGDVLIGGNVSTDTNGEYCIEDLNPDSAYFIFQPTQNVDGTVLEQQVSPLTRPGLPGLVIDSFMSTQQANASPPAPSSDSSTLQFSDENEAIGGERDLAAFLVSGDGEVRVNVNPFGNRPTLRYNSDVTVSGSGVVTWDGVDMSASNIAMGLGGRDLTNGGQETGIIFRVGAVAVGATAQVRLYQGSTSNVSFATLDVPMTTGGAAESYEFLPFVDFTGTVQPTNVDAIELILNADESGGNDLEMALIGANGPKIVNIAVNPGADLAVTKTDNRTSAIPGESLTYTVVVSNNGPSEVDGATIEDTLPTALTNATFTSVANGGATGNSAVGNGSIDDTVNMPSGSSITYTINGLVNPAASGTLTNTATVTPPAGVVDPNLSNNTAVDADTLTPTVDLSITKTNNTEVSMPGRQLTYTIVVANEGPSNAVGATVTDTFPANLMGVTYTSVATLGATGNTPSGTVGISDTVNLPVGSTITYTVTGTVSSNATGTISNTALVAAAAGTTDTDPSNNSATDTDSLSAEVDLRITKTDNQTVVQPGQVLNYVIVVNNDGPADAINAQVSDLFPASLTNVSFTSSGTTGVTGNSTVGTGSINDTVTMPVSSTLTYQVTATVSSSASGSLENTATVSPPDGVVDSVPSNNTATDINTVVPQFDLAITKTNGQATVVAGESTTYTIQVTNAGPSNVLDARVTDTFPSDLTNVTYTSLASGGATGNTPSGTGSISDTVDLPAGSTVTYTATGLVRPSATGTLSNTANVGVSQDESNPENNSATDTDTIVRRADLAITKTDNQSTTNAGDPLTYQVRVVNNGPSDVAGATVVDVLPTSLDGVSYSSVASGGASGGTNGPGNINDVVNLPVGSSINYTINAAVNVSATGTISNTATVTAPNGVTDTNPNNNTATDVTTIEQVLRSISGYVYVDLNNNGIFEPDEPPLRNVNVSLTGTELSGSPVSRSTLTEATGLYDFEDVTPGSYTVTETQPPLFANGRESIGTGSLTPVQATDNVFANLGLGAEENAENFNFGEQRSTLSKRDLLASRFI